MRMLVFISLLLMYTACTARQPGIEIEYPDGRTISVHGESGQAEPATLTSEGFSASTGGVDQAMSSMSKSTSWLAAILILAGLGILVASAWIPFLPRSNSIMLVASGITLYAFPVLLDRFGTVIIIGLCLLAGLFIFGMWDNRKKLNGNS